MPNKDTKKRVITGLDVFRKEGVTYQALKLLNPGTALDPLDDDLDDENAVILKKQAEAWTALTADEK